jgi:hypothetical protein
MIAKQKSLEANMRSRVICAALLMLSIPLLADAKDDYDMGQVRVTGKDEQGLSMKSNAREISQQMGEKTMEMPEILPETTTPETKPLMEKPFVLAQAKRAKKDFMSVGLGFGSRSNREFRFDGRGVYNEYTGELQLSKETRDGFRSTVEENRTQIKAGLKSTGAGSFELQLGGDYQFNEFAQRGTRAQATPHAGITDNHRAFSVKGHSTLANGAFFTGYANVNNTGRETRNRTKSFTEEATVFSGRFGGEYLMRASESFQGKAALDVAKEEFSIDNGPDTDVTKRVLALTGEYTFHDSAFLEFGFKNMGLLSKNRTAPVFRFDYRWDKPWQAILAYNEDLGNGDLAEVYLPGRYVPHNTLKASHRKRTSGKIQYRTDEKSSIGVELFDEKESDALEYTDAFDNAKGMLTSPFRHVGTAKRTGLKIGGTIQLDQNFLLTANSTMQKPKDSATGRQLSYEPKRILDVKLAYRSGPIEADYTRSAFFDRVAYAPAVQVNPGDYSRADMTVRYNFKKGFRAYLKVKDLYDDGKSIRFDVPEEGRVSTAGIEADF